MQCKDMNLKLRLFIVIEIPYSRFMSKFRAHSESLLRKAMCDTVCNYRLLKIYNIDPSFTWYYLKITNYRNYQPQLVEIPN